MTTSNLIPFFESLGSKIFYVEFIKRDGSLRKMRCRIGVKNHLKGGKLPYEPFGKGLLPVFDMHLQDYRMINLNTIKTIHADHKTFNID